MTHPVDVSSLPRCPECGARPTLTEYRNGVTTAMYRHEYPCSVPDRPVERAALAAALRLALHPKPISEGAES